MAERWPAHEVRALLLVGSTGHVTPEARAHLAPDLAALPDLALLLPAQDLWRAFARSQAEVAAFVGWLNTDPSRVLAWSHADMTPQELGAHLVMVHACPHRAAFGAVLQRRPGGGPASGLDTPARALPGHLCEQCLDAPAVRLVPAPWGGDMGVCGACQAPLDAPT